MNEQKTIEEKIQFTISGMVLCGRFEPYLKYCIESIKDLVDEILIVHPPMDDDEYERMFNKISHPNLIIMEQEGTETNFSKWRNQILDKAVGDWILMLDADEVFAWKNGESVNREDFEAMLEVVPDEIYSFQTYHFLYNYFTLDGRNDGKHYSLRLFKNRPDRRFKRKIHEYIDMERADVITGPMIWHFGHCKGMEDVREKYGMNMEIPENPYQSEYEGKTVDEYCSQHELFRGIRPMIHYAGPLPKCMGLW